MPPRTGKREELVERRRRLNQLRLRRAATPHRDDDDLALAREQPRDVPGDGRLPDAFAGPDHGDRRQLERMERRRVEAEVGADVRQPEREEARRASAIAAPRGPSTGSSERSTTISTSPGSSTIGTP